VHWHGVEGDRNMLVIDLLGPSLEELFRLCNRKFSLKTVLMLAIQMLDRIESMHAKGILHRDIKPENLLVGLDKTADQVHIVDLGLAKQYRDEVKQQHVSYQQYKGFSGTPRYASINTHLGIEQSRRDDLESIGYVLMYFLRGSLPWQGCAFDELEKVKEKKMSTPLDILCKDFAPEFETYLEYCQGLSFDASPDYDYLRGLFLNVLSREGADLDYVFDWSPSSHLASEDAKDLAECGSLSLHADSDTIAESQGSTAGVDLESIISSTFGQSDAHSSELGSGLRTYSSWT